MASDPDDGVHSIASIGASMGAQKGNSLAPRKGGPFAVICLDEGVKQRTVPPIFLRDRFNR